LLNMTIVRVGASLAIAGAGLMSYLFATRGGQADPLRRGREP
jgi:hypothetical protein